MAPRLLDRSTAAHEPLRQWRRSGSRTPQGAGADNSGARYDRSVEFVAEHGVETEDTVRGLLDDRGNETFPICRPWAESPTLPGVDTGTVCAIVMRLDDSEIDIRLGPDPAGSWQTHAV